MKSKPRAITEVRAASLASGEESQRAKERAAKKASRKQERAPGKHSGPTPPP